VKNAAFEFLPSAHKSAVEPWGTDFTIDSIALNGGALAVDINFGSNGSVVNSRFLGATIGAILIEGSDGARIAHNEFVRNEVGISASGAVYVNISGLTIGANSIEDGHVGIGFAGISESTVRDNVVRGHSRGISLEPNHCQDPPGPECQLSSGNVITGNTVRGNFIDLYHHETCIPNTWERNICRTKEGAEIPPCYSGRWRRPSRRLEPGSP
jgi:nitrous oxidase accessory protein NosD